MASLTEFQAFALETIKDNPGIRARELGEILWPDSYAHKKRSSCRNGVQKGKAMWLCAGSHVAKLRYKGWVAWPKAYGNYDPGYYLTQKGRAILKEDPMEWKGDTK